MALTRLSGSQLQTTNVDDISTDKEVNDKLNGHIENINPHVVYQLKSEAGLANGFATLGNDGKVPAIQLPSYVDDVIEFTNIINFPVIGETGKIYVALDTNYQYRWSGSIYISLNATGGLGYVPVNKAGDSMSGSLSLPKTTNTGLKVNNNWGWRDLIGDITPRSSGSLAPLLKNLVGNIREWAYSANDQGDSRFHLPHDYVPGSDLFIHVHWTHNGTAISGTIKIDFFVTYAKSHGQASFPVTLNPSLTVTSLNIANTPTLLHRVDEVQLSTPGGSTTLLNSNLIEVDGFILINYVLTTIPSISGSTFSNTPYVIGLDIHYQSNNMATANKTPNFYA